MELAQVPSRARLRCRGIAIIASSLQRLQIWTIVIKETVLCCAGSSEALQTFLTTKLDALAPADKAQARPPGPGSAAFMLSL